MLQRFAHAVRPVVLTVTLGVAASAALGAPPVASARFSNEVSYTFDQTWQASIRLLRVDLGCQVTDRDEDAGFILFEYPNAGRSYPGSMEIVRSTDSRGVEHVRVSVQVQSMPSYVERMVAERLTRKLRDDFGEPRTRRPARPAEPVPPEQAPDDAAPPSEGSDDAS